MNGWLSTKVVHKAIWWGHYLTICSQMMFSNDIYNYADDNSLVHSGYEYDDVKTKLLSNVNKVIKSIKPHESKRR